MPANNLLKHSHLVFIYSQLPVGRFLHHFILPLMIFKNFVKKLCEAKFARPGKRRGAKKKFVIDPEKSVCFFKRQHWLWIWIWVRDRSPCADILSKIFVFLHLFQQKWHFRAVSRCFGRCHDLYRPTDITRLDTPLIGSILRIEGELAIYELNSQKGNLTYDMERYLLLLASSIDFHYHEMMLNDNWRLPNCMRDYFGDNRKFFLVITSRARY